MFKQEGSVFLKYFTFLFLFYFLSSGSVSAQSSGGVGFWGELSVRFYCTVASISNLDDSRMCQSQAFLQSLSSSQQTQINNQNLAGSQGTTTVINNYIVATNSPQQLGNGVVYIPGPQGPRGEPGQIVYINATGTSQVTGSSNGTGFSFGGLTTFPFSGSAQFNGFGGSGSAGAQGPAGPAGVHVTNVSTTSNNFTILLSDGNFYTVDFPATSTTLFATSSNIIFSTTTNFFATNTTFVFASSTYLLSENSTLTNATTTNNFSENSYVNFFTSGNSTTVNSTTTNSFVYNLISQFFETVNFISENSTTTNSTSSNLFVTNSNLQFASSSVLFASTTNFVNGSSTLFFVDNSTFNSSTGTNLFIQNGLLEFASSSFVYATSANILYSTTSNLFASNSVLNFFTAGDSTTTNATTSNLFSESLTLNSLNARNTLTSSDNTITSNLAGSVGTTTIINSNTLSFNENSSIVTTNINGVVATTTIGNLYKFFASSTNLTVATDTFGNVTYTFTDNPTFNNVFSSLLSTLVATVNTLWANVGNFAVLNASTTNATTTNSLVGNIDNLNTQNATLTNATATKLSVNNLSVNNLMLNNLLSSATNTLTSNLAGSVGTTTIINSNTLTISTSTNSFEIISNVNGVMATTSAKFINQNSLNSAINTITSIVNGEATSTSIINSNDISFNENGSIVTTNINGITATTSLSSLYKFFALSTNLTVATDTFGNVTYTFTDNPTFNSVISQNATFTNSTSTNLFATIFNSVTAFISNLIFVNATGDNLQLANLYTTNSFATGTSYAQNMYSNYLFATTSKINNLTIGTIGAGANLNFATGTLYMTGPGGLSVNVDGEIVAPVVSGDQLVAKSRGINATASETAYENILVASGLFSDNIIMSTGLNANNWLQNLSTIGRNIISGDTDINTFGASTTNIGNANILNGTASLTNATISNLFVSNISVPNSLTSNTNTLSSNIGGSVSTTTIINNNTLTVSTTTNSFELVSNVNGIISTTSAKFINQNSLNSAINTITSIVNGEATSTSIINSNSISTSTNSFFTLVNGISSEIVNFINSFSQTSSGNILTTNINGLTATSSIINSNNLSFNETGSIVTTSVNGITATTSLSSLYKFFASSTNLTVATDTLGNVIYTFNDSPTFNTLVSQNGTFANSLVVNGNGLLSNVVGLVGGNTLTAGGIGIANTFNASGINSQNQILATGIGSVNTILGNTNLNTSGIGQTNIGNANIISGTGNLTNIVSQNATFTNATATNLSVGDLSVSNLKLNNLLSSAANILSSNIAGSVGTTTIINSNSISTSTNSLTTFINGIASNVVEFINLFTQTSSGNTLTTNINGLIATSSIINNNTLTISTSTNTFELVSNVNGIIATTTAEFVNQNNLLSTVNQLTSIVNGKTATTSLISSSSLNADGGIITTTINGVTATTSINNLYKFLASSTNLSVATDTLGNVTYIFTSNPQFASLTANVVFATSTITDNLNVLNMLSSVLAYVSGLLFDNATGTRLQLADLNTTNVNATGTINSSLINATNLTTTDLNVSNNLNSATLTSVNFTTNNAKTNSLNSLLVNTNNLNSSTTDTGNMFANFIHSRQQGMNSQAITNSAQNFLYAGGNFSQNRIISDGSSLGNFILGDTFINTTGASSTNIGNANILNGNAVFTHANVVNATATNLSTINATFTNATATNLSVGDLSVSNLKLNNLLSSAANILSSNIAGSVGTTTIINSNSLSFNENNSVVTTNINGVVATTTISNLYKFFASSTNLTVATDTVGNVTYSFADNPLFNNIISSNITTNNILSANGQFFTATIANATITNSTSTNLFTSLLNAVTAYFTNLSATNATISNATITNLAVENFTGDTLQKIATNTANNIAYSTTTKILTSIVNGKVATTTIVISDLPAILDGEGINISTTSTSTTISLDLSNFVAGTGTISSTSIFTANVANLFASFIDVTNGTIDQFVADNATITNLIFLSMTGANAQLANLSTTNLTATGTTNLNIANINLLNATSVNASSSIFGSLVSTRGVFAESTSTYATFTKIFADIIKTNSVAYNGLIGDFATLTNATLTSLFANNADFIVSSNTNLFWKQATGGRATVTNLAAENLYGFGQVDLVGSASENFFGRGVGVENYFGVGNNATNYFGGVSPSGPHAFENIFVATKNTFLGSVGFDGGLDTTGGIEADGNLSFGTILGGYIHIGNDANNTEINSYDILLGTKDDTNSVVIGSSTNAVYIEGDILNSSIVLGKANFINATVGNATTTNLFADMLTAITGVFTNLVAIDATLTNATTTNLRVSNLLSAVNAVIDSLVFTNILGTNATITNGTSTNWFSNNLFATNGTITKFYSPNISGNLASITSASFGSILTSDFQTTDLRLSYLLASMTMSSIYGNLYVGSSPYSATNSPYKVNFVDTVPGTNTGSAAFAMTNLASNTSNTNAVLRLNLGASNPGTCSGVTGNSAYATNPDCGTFVRFFRNATSEVSGESVGHISLKELNGSGRIVFNTNGADFGENLMIEEYTEFGDIISKTDLGNVKSTKNKPILGVVSNNTGFVGNMKQLVGDNDRTVGYLGIVHTKVSIENGPIKKGDPIGLGSKPGIGVKMLKAGYIVGHAIENFSLPEVGKIEVQVAPTWFDPNVLLSGESLSTTTVTQMIVGSISSSTESQESKILSIVNLVNNINRLIDEALSNPNTKLAASVVNNALDSLFIEYFTATSTIEKISVNNIDIKDLLDTSFAATSSLGTLEKLSFTEMQFYMLGKIASFNKVVDKFNENVLSIAEVVADKISTKEIKTEKLCIGNTCVTEDELKALLEVRNNFGSVVNSSNVQTNSNEQSVPDQILQENIGVAVPTSTATTSFSGEATTTANEVVQTETVETAVVEKVENN